MTDQDRTLLLDTNILIAAWRDYYAQDIFPGFWECLESFLLQGKGLIIDRVKDEITSPADLVTWVKQLPPQALASTSDLAVQETYGTIIDWVQKNPQFTDAAKEHFARKADGWLVAYAKVNDMVVVTNEVLDRSAKRIVKLPNVCDQFDVKRKDTNDMLRYIEARFDWRQ